MEKHSYEDLRKEIQDDLEREMQCKFPIYYRQFPDSFCEAVMRDVYNASTWKAEGRYSQDDINLAIQREVLLAVEKNDRPDGSDGRNCFNCAASMSADDESGEQCLVCSTHGYEKVPEDGYCEDYN